MSITTQLQLLKSEKFGEVQADIYTDTSEMFMTINQLAECLGYASTAGLGNIISRNDYLNTSEFSTTHKLCVVEGNRTVTRNIKLFNEQGIYEVAFLSKTDIARQFRSWVRGILTALRKGELQISSSGVSLSSQVIDEKIQQLLGTVAEQSKDINFIKQRVFQLSETFSYLAKQERDKANVWKRGINTRIIELNKISGISRNSLLNQLFCRMSENGCNLIKLSNEYAFQNSMETCSLIDYIDQHEDVKKEFEKLLSNLESLYKIKSPDESSQVVSSKFQNLDFASQTTRNIIRSAIEPLIKKYNDNSTGGNATYRKVYAAMDVSWANRMTRYKKLHGLKNLPKKHVLIEADTKLFNMFISTVNRLLVDGVVGKGL